jgi:NAD(P)-dependent dehydrogenase (short-subunit alcohol dehydrogenase family)
VLLSERVVLIAGTGRGLGSVTARAVLREGGHVVLGDRLDQFRAGLSLNLRLLANGSGTYKSSSRVCGEGGFMKRLFASAAVVAVALVGVAGVTAATASAAPPTEKLQGAWGAVCINVEGLADVLVPDEFVCFGLRDLGSVDLVDVPSPPLEGLCNAAGGRFESFYLSSTQQVAFFCLDVGTPPV